jgi:pimeloyl-ACP methyl ester carboxylesterase
VDEGTPLAVVADDGAVLHAEVSGARDAALTVVFCHGLALDRSSWHFQRIALAGKVRLVVYDQRGHGRSDRGGPENATIDQLGRDLYQVLEQIVPPGPVVLVGHSMGGMAIMALAEAHPDLFSDRIAAVGLLSSSAGSLAKVTLGLPSYSARTLHLVLAQLTRVAVRRWGVLECGRRTADDLAHLLMRRYAFVSTVQPMVLELAARMIGATPLEVIGSFYATFTNHDRLAALSALADVPTMILAGADDAVTPVEHSEAIMRMLPSAELVVLPSTGHIPLLERPDEVNSCLTRLLDQAGAMATVTAAGRSPAPERERGAA